MEEYEDMFKKLAALLGWTDVYISEFMPYGFPPNPQDYGLKEGRRMSMPNWIANDNDAFRLMVAYDCYPKAHDFGVECDGIKVVFSNHRDKYTAVRVAIVKAVIAKLEG